MASAAAAATLGPCKESLRWIWTLPSAPRVKSSFRHELLQTVYIHINDVYILEPLELENYSTTVNLKATCQLWYFKFAFRNMSCVHWILLLWFFCPSSPALCFAQATQKNQTLADEMIMKTMVKAGHKVRDQWEKHHIRKLDTLTTIRRWSERETQIPPRKWVNFNSHHEQ